MTACPEEPPAESVRAEVGAGDTAWDAFLVQRQRQDRAISRAGSPRLVEDAGSALLEALEGQDTGSLVAAGWLTRLEAITRLESELAAMKAATIAGFDDLLHGVSADLGHHDPVPGDRDATAGERRWHGGLLRSVADEVGLVLGLHRGAANAPIKRSWELVHNFPATLAALAAGTLTERAAFTVVDELSSLEDRDKIGAAEAAVLAWADQHPLQRIKQVVRREAVRQDVAAVEHRYRREIEERSVRMVPTEYGTVDLISTHDAVAAANVMSSLSAAAIQLRRAGDSRTLDQLRADIALGRLLGRPADRCDHAGTNDEAVGLHTDGSTCHGSPHLVGPRRPAADAGVAEVVIHGTAAELRALLENTLSSGGEAPGLGPLPQGALRAALTRALGDPAAAAGAVAGAASRTVRFQVSDRPPDGDPDRYIPSRDLAQYVRDRDRRCRFAGCNRPAQAADLDHRVPHGVGGETSADNLHCLCRHHHRLKHRGGWAVRRNPDGSQTWISPTGREYRDEPPDP